MADSFKPIDRLKATPIDDGRPSADPFTAARATGRITLDSSADMFAFVNQGASVAPNRGPFSITPAQMTRGGRSEDIVLVAINGTHLGWAQQARQSTGIMTDLRAGTGIENAYVRSVTDEIMKLPPGTKVVLAGHSLGGIVAQEIAADPRVQGKLTVLNTVTFGSPPIKPGDQEGTVHRLIDEHDPVPLLSWDAVKSNVAKTVGGALKGGQEGIDRSREIAGRGIRGLFSREMVESVLRIPGAAGDGAVRGVGQSAVYANTTIRDADMAAGAAGIPGTNHYLSFTAHQQSYADPRTWAGVTALGEDHSAATKTAITFNERDVRWRMTEPVNTHRVWSLPVLDRLRPLLSEADPSQGPPTTDDRPATRLARADEDTTTAARADAVSGERVHAALALVVGSGDGMPEPAAFGGTRPEQLAAVRDVMAGRGVAATPEQAAAVLDLAGTLDAAPERADRPSADRPGAGPDATRLAQAERPVAETGPSV